MKLLYYFFIISLTITYEHRLEATLGYFSIGFGTKAKGMGGVAVAFPQDSIVAATNPAGMVWVGNRCDVGAELFEPIRRFHFTGGGATDNESGGAKSHSNIFLVPHAGYNRMISQESSLGLTLYGQGLNTNFPCNIPTVFGTGALGMNYLQIMVAPTVAKKIRRHSFGASLLGGIQAMKIEGLQNLANPVTSMYPCSVTNNAHSLVPGIGARIGWMLKLTDHVNLGFSYSTKIYMKKFDIYKGLFAGGSLDIPANFLAGIAIEDIYKCTLAFDFMYIFYADVPPIGNSICQFAELPFNFQQPVIKNKLGSKCGPGFGWQNLPCFKIGAASDAFEQVTLRSGYVYCPVPFAPLEIDFNIVSPGVTKHHITGGFTYYLDDQQAVDVALQYVLNNKFRGSSQFSLGIITLEMWQFSIEVNYGIKF